MYETTYPEKRFRITMDWIKRYVQPHQTIFDLGVPNPLSRLMEQAGYQVINTQGEDLDYDTKALREAKYEVFTSFEIFEHLLNPLGVVQAVQCDRMLVSVPLRLWFAKAYRSHTDPRDRHYHEFEDWQLDWLLEKGGFEVKARHYFTHPTRKLGLRPLLRLWTPRYYLVYAERQKA